MHQQPTRQVGRFINSTAQARFFQKYEEAMKRWPSSYQEQKVETRFGETHIYSYGSGTSEPIVLLHGANSTSASWANFAARLGEHHPVFAVDIIGEAGRSVQQAPIQHAEDYVIWLDEVLQGLGVNKVHLVGASYVGFMALNQAIHSPRRLHSITLLDPVRAFAGISFRAWLFMLWASIIGPDVIRRAFIRWTSASPVTDEHQTQLVITAMRDYKMKRPAPQYIDDAKLQAVKIPALLLLGAKSPLSCKIWKRRSFPMPDISCLWIQSMIEFYNSFVIVPSDAMSSVQEKALAQ